MTLSKLMNHATSRTSTPEQKTFSVLCRYFYFLLPFSPSPFAFCQRSGSSGSQSLLFRATISCSCDERWQLIINKCKTRATFGNTSSDKMSRWSVLNFSHLLSLKLALYKQFRRHSTWWNSETFPDPAASPPRKGETKVLFKTEKHGKMENIEIDEYVMWNMGGDESEN